MNLVTFPLRVKPELKTAISDHAVPRLQRDRARVENRTQTDLIREAVKRYLLTPDNRKTAS